MEFSPQQWEAIATFDKNLVVTAGAGSGKTRVLVERYLNLLIENPQWTLNSVVAITFTREAALEMRNRVRRELSDRLNRRDVHEGRYAQLLSQMDSARIDTIHALCTDILRANAAEAQIDPSFDVLDDIEATLLRERVVSDIEQSLSVDDPQHLLALLSVVDIQTVRTTISHPELLAHELPAMPDDLEALVAQWDAMWNNTYLEKLERLKTMPVFQEALSSLPNPIDQNDKLYPAYANAMRIYDLFSPDFETSWRTLESITAKDAFILSGGKADSWGGKEAVTQLKDALKVLREFVNIFHEEVRVTRDLEYIAAELTILWHGWLSRAQFEYRQAKQRAGVLDFNDLEQMTMHLLQAHESVRLRYQNGEIQHLLVDEFQDTNRAQWEIVKALVSLERDGSIFVVGDIKQSIYGFRGADVSVFDGVRGEIAHRHNGKRLPLAVSYRTHPALIDAFNTLFKKILIKDPTSAVVDYQVELEPSDEMTAHRDPMPVGDGVPFHPLEIMLYQHERVNESTSKKESLSAEEYRQWEGDHLARWLKGLHDQQAHIHDKELNRLRPFEYSDAVFLFQSTSNIKIYEDALDAYDIPFVTISGRGFYARQEVWDALNLLRVVYNRADNLSLATVLRSPMFGFSDDLLLRLRLPNQSAVLWEALQADHPTLSADDRQRVTWSRGVLDELVTLVGRTTIVELLRIGLEKTGYLAILTGMRGGARLRRNVEKLLEVAQNSGQITLGSFIEYVSDLSSREVREGEAAQDASAGVKLMTVHASKGLEFPIVILPDTGWSFSNRNEGAVLIDQFGLICQVPQEEGESYKPFIYRQSVQLRHLREDAERKRLLYVAMTRAGDCVVLSGSAKNKNGWESKGWLNELLDALDLRTRGEGVYAFTPQATMRLSTPEFDEAILKRTRTQQATHDSWNTATFGTDAGFVPPLLQPIQPLPETLLKHISATQLADIGGYRYVPDRELKRYYRQSFSQGILDDASAQVTEAIHRRQPRVTRRIVGQIVHEALRHWQFPNNKPPEQLNDLLEGYAWRFNLTETADIEFAIDQAKKILTGFQASDVYQWMTEARLAHKPIYPELPFIYRTEKRILHGIMDVLFQATNGEWVIVDYKTGYLAQRDLQTATEHTQQYYLQVGAYAEAVKQRMGQDVPLRVYIHYISYHLTVEVQPHQWQTELNQLEDSIGRIVGDRHD